MLVFFSQKVFSKEIKIQAIKKKVDYSDFSVIIEPSFYKSETARQIKGAKFSHFVPVRLGKSLGIKNRFEKLSLLEFARLGINWNDLFDDSVLRSENFFRKIDEPKIYRDENGVISYMSITNTNKSPFFMTVIFTKAFYNNLNKKMGEVFYLTIPDRVRAYIFPIGASKKILENIYKLSKSRYEKAIFPVSKEIFLIKKNDFSVVGNF